VNDSGTAVGVARKYVAGVAVGDRAVRWNASGTTATELGVLGTGADGITDAVAVAVNHVGTAVGFADKYISGVSAGTRAVRWDGSGTVATELEDLGTSLGGITNAEAYSVNHAGSAVGRSDKYVDGISVGESAAIWLPDASVIDLNDLGLVANPADGSWLLTEARAISADGWVTGIGEFTPTIGDPYRRHWVTQVGLGGEWTDAFTDSLDGTWGRGPQWSTGTPAMQVGDAVFNALADYTVSLDRDELTRTISVNAGRVNFEFNDHSLTSQNGLSIAVGATFAGSGEFIGNVTNSGTLAPGNSPGIIEIDGDYEQSATGTLEIEVDGLTPGTEHDQVQITGTATLAGRLKVPILDGSYHPQVDDEVIFLTADMGVTGVFSALTSPGLTDAVANVAIELDYNATDVRVRFVATRTDVVLDYPAMATVEWSDPNTWTTGMADAVPGSANIISVQNLVGATPQRVEVESQNAFVHKLTVGGAGVASATTITLAVQNGQTLSSTTSVDVVGGTDGPGVIELDGGTLVSPTITIGSGAQLTGNGRVVGELVLNGTISPGFSIGQIEVEGDLLQGANGTIEVELNDTAPGQGDTINVTGVALLDGTLRIDASNFVGTNPGDTFEIISAGTLNGTFQNVESFGNNNIYFDDIYDAAGGGVSVMQLDRGDMNGDAIIDETDYELFVFGLMNSSVSKFLAHCECDILPHEGGDFSGNGRLDFEDIPGFQNQLGGMGMSTAGLSAAFENYFNQVPEPSSAVLMVVAGLMSAPGRSRPRGRKNWT
jgi:hypothetical protein